MICENQFTLRGISVWFICAIFFLYEFLLRTVIGTFQHPVMYDLELSTIQFSILSSTVYLLIYAAMQLPVGFMVDRIGLKKSLIYASLICGISSFAFGFVTTYTFAIICRFFIGLGSSFGFICLLVAVYDWMPKRHITLMIGVSQFVGVMGPIMAAGPLESIASSASISWREIFIVLGIAGVALAIISALFVCNNQEKVGRYIILKRPESIYGTLRVLCGKSQPWLIAIFGGLVYFSLEYLSENEGKAFVILKGHTSTFASYMITLAWLGYAIGCPMLGFLSDRFSRRRPTMMISAVSCTLGIFGVVFLSERNLLMISFLLLGIGASGQSIGFAIISEQFKKNYRAVALSLNNGMMTFFAAINAPILGGIIECIHTGEGVPTLDHYTVAFILLLVLVSLSLLFPVFFIKETFCKSQADYIYLQR